jgi:CRP-like cAMP-binding protein
MDIKEFKKGDLILKQGDKDEIMYFITEGKVNVYTTIDEKKIDIQQLEKEDFFGEMSMFLDMEVITTLMNRLKHAHGIIKNLEGEKQSLLMIYTKK